VREAGIGDRDLVIDIGAGRGALTTALRRVGATVVALELDPRLAQSLRERFIADDRVGVATADARHWTWPEQPFAVVSNLPFAAAASILQSLLDDPRVPLLRAHVIVQWEFAAKHAATWPSTLRGVYWGAWWDLAIGRRLAPNAFAPPTSVASAVLAVDARADALIPVSEHRAYSTFLRAVWRDAPIRRILTSIVGPRQLKRLATENGFDDRAFPRDLDARQWAALYLHSRR